MRKNPSADSAVVRQVSGTRVGYELVSGRNDEWSLLYGEDSELIGWVRSEAVVSPDRARKAALKRTLDDTRPDGSPTDEALKTLVLLDLAESNRRSPDLGGLVGDMELRSFEVIACDDAVNEAGYNCDVRGRLDTNNMGVQAMQGMLSRLGGNTGRSGVVPYRAQLRVAQNRDGLWRIVESRGLQ